MFGEIFAPLLPFWSTGGNCSRPPSSFPLFPISDCTNENFYWNPSGKIRKRVHTPFFARKVIKILCHPPHPRGKLFLGSFFVGTKPYLPSPLIIRGKSKIGLLSRRGKNAQISCLGRKEEKKLLPSFSLLCLVQSTDPLSPGCEGNREMLNWRKKKPQSPPKKVCVGVNFSTQVDARPAVSESNSNKTATAGDAQEEMERKMGGNAYFFLFSHRHLYGSDRDQNAMSLPNRNKCRI